GSDSDTREKNMTTEGRGNEGMDDTMPAQVAIGEIVEKHGVIDLLRIGCARSVVPIVTALIGQGYIGRVRYLSCQVAREDAEVASMLTIVSKTHNVVVR